LNDRNKHLGVRNILRGWKVDIVCFQEIELEFTTCSVVR
jgi:mRNA deadenylase 3'-5' endonuclease subunit Ccr4